MKRSISLLLVVAVVAVLFAVGYWLRYRGSTSIDLTPIPNPSSPQPLGGGSLPTSQGAPAAPVPTGGIPAAGGEKAILSLVAQNPALSYFVLGQNDFLLAQPDGQIVEVTGGQAAVLSSQTIADLREIAFSSDGQKIIAVFGDLQSPQVSLFDTTSKTWQPLELHVPWVAWSPTGRKIAYFVNNGDVSTLTTLDVNDAKAKPQEILRLHEQDLFAEWTASTSLLLKDRGTALVPSSLWRVDISKKTLFPVILDQIGLQALWEPKTNQGLSFTSGLGGRGGALSLVDNQGKSLLKLNFLALPSKCAFDASAAPGPTSLASSSTALASSSPSANQNVLYCAVPNDTNRLKEEILPDNYEQKSLFTADSFMKVLLAGGALQKVFEPAQSIDAINLRIVNGVLFFINRLDSRLYALSLPGATPQ